MEIKEALPIGTILDSGKRKYTIKSVLGQGGFGITYLATSTIYVDNIPFETQFAIKEHYISSMNERQGASVSVSNANNTEEIKESIDSFLIEAQRLNKLSLNHSGLVRVNESFRSNGTAYYVMEYIKGQSLREYVRCSPLGRLLEAEALQLFRPVAETIDYLHENKITHLDIKPDNILIRENGEPVVIDFGLSKHYSSKGTPTSTIKAAGCSAGYSPMEQYVGITTFTPEADIYALAATLLYMLTGKDPIVSTEISSDIIRKSLPNDVSEQTCSSIVKAMEKLKENRTATIKEFHNCLQGLYGQTCEILEKGFQIDNHATKRLKTKSGQQSIGHNITTSKNRWGFVSLIIAGMIILSGVILLYYFNDPHSKKVDALLATNSPSKGVITDFSKQYPNDTIASYCDRLNNMIPFYLFNDVDSRYTVQKITYDGKNIYFLIFDTPNGKWKDDKDLYKYDANNNYIPDYSYTGTYIVGFCHVFGKEVIKALVEKHGFVRFDFYTQSPQKIVYSFKLTTDKLKYTLENCFRKNL